MWSVCLFVCIPVLPGGAAPHVSAVDVHPGTGAGLVLLGWQWARGWSSSSSCPVRVKLPGSVCGLPVSALHSNVDLYVCVCVWKKWF